MTAPRLHVTARPASRIASRLASRIAPQPRSRPGFRSDAGMTLTEVLIASLLTVIVIVLMIPLLVPYLKIVESSRTHSTSTSEAEIVFERIDSEVRFASAINQQGYGKYVNGDTTQGSCTPTSWPANSTKCARYVEWLTPAESSPTGKALCTQWRYVPATGAIEERQWNLDSTPPSTFTQRMVLALDQTPNDTSGLNEDAFKRPVYPFAMASATNAQPLQSLTVWVYAGDSTIDATTQIKTRFVARNSAISAVTNDNATPATGWGSLSVAGGVAYPWGAGYADPTANATVPYVCSASVSTTGVVTAFTGSTVFRP